MLLPRISIIVPVYNVEKYLSKTLDSVLAQTFNNFELILVDDGSVDNSPIICDEYAKKDSRIYVVHQNNLGVSSARNRGIEISHGEWISFIDSDDWVDPQYLEKFDVDNSEGVDLIIQGLEFYHQRDGRFFSPLILNSCTICEQEYIAGFAENRLLELGYPTCKVFRRNLLMLNGLHFDPRVSFHEDHIFVLDYYQLCHTIRVVDAIGYKYRCYHTDTSLSFRPHAWDKLNLAGDEMLKRLEAMSGRFFIIGSKTAKHVYTFAYECKMNAARSIIQSNRTYSEKKAIFKGIVDRKQLSRFYYPESSRARIMKSIYKCFPFFGVVLFHKSVDLIKKI